ncbi:hypothetical protein J7L13_03310 [bacterium]|nr:hypothetical protein [bacterium]
MTITVAKYYNPKRNEYFYTDPNLDLLTEDPRYPDEMVWFVGFVEI